ncbi:lipopolysaccharide-induced tumor necrosis factor-alpha factor homolog [Callorhinchus milii]|uniref:lipopolysaccharide-induced tumor necrosis factor-alpha factor homolog n=1 Tax=Callorhinchus milii TaxID=7868 RepID=UPI0004573745|nr:lipopolysaccharide-induced tumor necrosis factor-alpha factor homolog [Callorhinchus milii]|eukprot:gi/632979640/ref/XP_007906581.1/ PREDICTED: lipopolysaccharide-induced tumor necrosis factor-alpha factor [Callorhinchus milii]
MTCPACKEQIITNIHHMPGALTWLVCSGLALFGFVVGCCLIPFFMDSLQDVKHTCPNCSMYIGTFKRL